MNRILFIIRVDRTNLLQKMQEYIRESNIKCEIVVLSDSMWNPCRKFIQNYIYMQPNVNEENFIKSIIEEYSINGIMVASNYDLKYINNMQEWLKKKKINFYGPDFQSLLVCLSKKKQYSLLREHDIPVVNMYSYDEIMKSNCNMFPLIIKPSNGQGSKNIIEISSREELVWSYNRLEDPVIQPKIEGKEYTIDCFNDYKGKVLLSVPRERLVVDGPHTIVAKIHLNETLNSIAFKISRIVKIVGPWNFQVFEVNNKYIVHDINPRIANGLCFSITAGAPFEALIIDYLLGEEKEASIKMHDVIEDKKVLYQYSKYF